MPRTAAWLPFIMAGVLEIMWLMALGTALVFFSLLGGIFMTGLSSTYRRPVLNAL